LLVRDTAKYPRDDRDVTTRLTPAIPIADSLVSSAMDTVTESATAIRMAREGRHRFIHKNLPIEDHGARVSRVKKAQSGIVVDPVTIALVSHARGRARVMRHHRSRPSVVDTTGARRHLTIATSGSRSA